VDLRWLSEIDINNLLNIIGDTSHILIVDECRRSGSYGEGLLADLQTACARPFKFKLHASKNSFIPIGEGATSTLVSKDSIIKAAIELYNE